MLEVVYGANPRPGRPPGCGQPFAATDFAWTNRTRADTAWWPSLLRWPCVHPLG